MQTLRHRTHTAVAKHLLLVALLTQCTPQHAIAAPKRSKAVLRAFVTQHACPATGLHRLPCPGYIIDHITPLACNGADAPFNLQWQTREDAKAKDKWERQACDDAHKKRSV